MNCFYVIFMAKTTLRIDGAKRFSFPNEYLSGLSRDSLYLCKDGMRVRRRGIFRFVDIRQIGYKTLNFLKMTDNLPQTQELLAQFYASKDRHVELDGKNRILIKDEEMNHAGIAQECVLIKNEGSNPYVGIWSPRNWGKYDRAVRSYAS